MVPNPPTKKTPRLFLPSMELTLTVFSSLVDLEPCGISLTLQMLTVLGERFMRRVGLLELSAMGPSPWPTLSCPMVSTWSKERVLLGLPTRKKEWRDCFLFCPNMREDNLVRMS